jgi:hypothetical protein
MRTQPTSAPPRALHPAATRRESGCSAPRAARGLLAVFLLGALPVCAAPEAPARHPLRLSPTNAPAEAHAAWTETLHFPGQVDRFLHAPKASDWADGHAIAGRLVWPAEAPKSAQLMAFMKDRDGRWFQKLRPEPLQPGTNAWCFDFSAEAPGWSPVGHHLVWNYRTRLAPQMVGLRVFSLHEAYTGACQVVDTVLLATNRVATPPAIRNVRPNSRSIPCYGLFELRFELPDRYANPFDPAAIDVTAFIETPDGSTNAVHGFYMQDYFRLVDAVGEQMIPQGRPEWRVRYTPRVPGLHRYVITARDAVGTATSDPGAFEARAATGPGFVQVARKDWRFFELDDGSPFFPIGHNTRSPFDTRMDEQFPWRFRHPEGTSAYQRYFINMSAAGENLAEVWMCQWSLGLEWSSVSPGYHGLGDYHLGNAWELDEVLRWARESKMRINLVLNNHGRAGLGYDAEWDDSPYNVARGGFLPADDPMPFFDNPRAIDLQRRISRYIVARWGWDSTIFAWELWSELDLVGKHGAKPAPQNDPRVIDWHRQIGDYLRTIDPNRHLVTTHLSGDYRITSPELAQLPQLDHCGIDAYHFSDNPLQIVNLVRETAEHYKAYQKPVLITEFGGSSMGAGVSHLKRELHAALWSSVCTPLAGTPLFWWWQVIEEQNLYPMYTAIARFMADVDRRDPAFQPIRLGQAFAGGLAIPDGQVDHVAMATPTQALGWLFIRPCFLRHGEPLDQPLENLTLTWSGCSNTVYRIAFHDTGTGRIIQQRDERAENGTLRIRLPPVSRDLAFKIRLPDEAPPQAE